MKRQKCLKTLLVTVVFAALLGNSLSSFRAMGSEIKYSESIRVQAATVTMEDTNTGVSRADMVGVTGEGITGGYPAFAGANSALAAIKEAQDANSGAVRDYTVWLLADVTFNESFVVPAGAHIALDLNGHSITGNLESGHGFSVSGQNAVLHVQGTGNIDIQTKGGVGFFNYVLNNELTIDISGTISHSDSAGFSSSCVVINGGTFQLTNGILYEKNRYGILNQGSVSIEGGTVTGGMAAAFGTTGTWNISGGTFGNVVRIGGSATANINGEVKRPADYTGTMFLLEDSGNAVVTGTVDGGAIWCGDENPLLGRGEVNDGVTAGGSEAFSLEAGGFLFAVKDTAALTLEDGAILQNNERLGDGHTSTDVSSYGDADRGGAVLVEHASLFIEDGAIVSGCAAQRGAAVYAEGGAVSMTGGYLTACSAALGGGIFLCEGAQMSLTGGQIDACTADTAAGGIYVTEDAGFFVSGEPVVKNNTLMAAGEAELPIHSNIHLVGSAQVTQTGDLTERAELYITHETEPTEGTTFGVDTQGFGGSGRYFSDQDVNFTAERNPQDNSLIWTIQVPELPAAGRGRQPELMGAVSMMCLVLWLRLLRRFVGRKSDE